MKATQSIIVNCWPRVTIYKAEILRGLVMCWCKIEEDGPEDFDTIRAAINDTVKLLTAAVGDPTVVKADYDNLINADARLIEIFKIVS